MLGRGQHKDRLDTSVHGPVSLSDSTFVFKIGRRPQAPDNDVGIHLPAKIYGQTEIRFYRHPIAAYEFLGPNLKGKDMILIDDMISSGDTVLKISSLLKERGAGRIYICSTFGLFTNGLEKFDEAHKAGVFDKLLTTNLIYQSPELLAKDYYISCDMSKYIALIIDTLNHDQSVSYLLNPVDRINRCVSNYMAQYDEK